MTEQPTGKPCAFCGQPMSKSAGTAVTKEHGFPLWLLPWLGHDDEPSKGVTHTIREALDGPVLREWTADELDIVARKVCEPCNGGWMNDLENMARPHLIPLMEGKLRVLDAPAQRIVAAWAVKTALSLSLANAAAQPIAMEHYRAMARLKRRPPPKTHVWLAAYRGWRNAFHCENTLTFTGSMGSVVDGYATTFSVARPIFHIVGHSHQDEMTISKGGAFPHMTAQIWPVEGLANWPPPTIVPDDGLLSLAANWNS